MGGNAVFTQQAVGIFTDDRMNDYTRYEAPVSNHLAQEPGLHENFH